MNDSDTDPDSFKPSDPQAQTEADGEDDWLVFSPDRSCDNCAHAPVCAILAGIRPMLQNWSAGTEPDAVAPVELYRLALICEAFLPADEVN